MNAHLHICSLAALAFMAVAGPARAASTAEEFASTTRTSRGAALVAGPTAQSAFATTSQAQVLASRDDSKATVSVSRTMQGTLNTGSSTSTTLALIAEAPMTSGSGNTTLASLDGLGGGSTITVKLSQLSMKGALTPDPGAYDAGACKSLLERAFTEYQKSHVEGARDLKDIHCDTETVSDAVDKGLVPKAELVKISDLLWGKSAGLLTWSIAMSGGYVDSTWYDPTTLAKTQGREGQWSGSGQIGYAWLNPTVPTALSASLAVKSSPTAAASRSTCLASPPAGQSQLACADGPIGAPTRKTTEVLSLESRAVFDTHYAAQLTLARDFRNHLSTVNLPMYFIPSDKTGLSGGVSLGWSNADHKATLGVFVGQSFSLL